MLGLIWHAKTWRSDFGCKSEARIGVKMCILGSMIPKIDVSDYKTVIQAPKTLKAYLFGGKKTTTILGSDQNIWVGK